MFRSVILSASLAAYLLFSPAFAASSASDAPWPTFRGGQFNQGVSNYSLRGSCDGDCQVKEIELGGLIWSTPVIDRDGTVYVGTTIKRMFALNPNGDLKWSYMLFDRADSLVDSAAALTASGKVIVPGGDGFLHGVDAKTGERLWTFEAKGVDANEHSAGATVNSFEGNVVIGPNGLIYAGSDNAFMYAIDENGKERWHYETGMTIWSIPCFDKDGRWMAFGSLDGKLYLLNPETGAKLDIYDAKSDIKTAVVTDGQGRIYFGTSGGHVVALKVEKKNGQYNLRKLWSFKANGEIYSSPALANGRIFFGSMGGSVYALSTNGKLAWQYRTYSPVASSPVVTRDGALIFGAANGKFFALDTQTGNRRWSYRTVDSIQKVNLDASPALDPEGNIWVGSYRGIFYRIPSGYCLTVREKDERCEFGGMADVPEFALGPNAPSNVATLRAESMNGHYERIVTDAISRSAPLRLRLVVFRDGEYLPTGAISASGLKVRLWRNGVEVNAKDEISWRVSSDGKYLNILPRTFLASEAKYEIEVRGAYYPQKHWIMDRLQFFSLRKFRGRIEFRTMAASPVAWPKEGAPGFAIKSLYLMQPKALDTNVPAALDAQGYIMRPFAVSQNDDRFLALVLPGLPSDAGVDLLPEPNRAFVVEARKSDEAIMARGKFELSAMGATIPFDWFVMNGRLDQNWNLVDSTFTVSASCLSVKGNSKSYRFPYKMINQVCDHELRMSGIAMFKSQTLAPTQAPSDVRKKVELLGKGRDAQWYLTVTQPEAWRNDGKAHVVSAILFDAATKKLIDSKIVRIEPNQWNGGKFRVRLDGFAYKYKGGFQVFIDDVAL